MGGNGSNKINEFKFAESKVTSSGWIQEITTATGDKEKVNNGGIIR